MGEIIKKIALTLIVIALIFLNWYLALYLKRTVNYNIIYKKLVYKSVYEILEKENLIKGANQ